MEAMTLRPHHILDIVTEYGKGTEFKPCRYGHDLHRVAGVILADLEHNIQLVIGSDEICKPCIHLDPTGRCDDILNLDPPKSKQEYNDDLDQRLCDCLSVSTGPVMTARRFLEAVNATVPGIEAVCTHPGEDPARRLAGLTSGLQRLGIRDGDGTSATGSVRSSNAPRGLA